MLQSYLTEKPTWIEAMAIGRDVIPEKDRVAAAGAVLRDFEEKWKFARRKTL